MVQVSCAKHKAEAGECFIRPAEVRVEPVGPSPGSAVKVREIGRLFL